MLPMSRMKDLSVLHPAPVEDHLTLQVGHSAHLRVFLKGLEVSPGVIHSEVSRLVIHLGAFPVVTKGFLVGILLEAFPAAIPSVAVSPVEVVASTVASAVDN